MVMFKFLKKLLFFCIICLINYKCLLNNGKKISYESIDYKYDESPQGISYNENTNISKEKMIITFLGVNGHESCFEAIHEELEKNGINYLAGSPNMHSEFNVLNNCCAKVDGFYMEKYKTHLGLGALVNQACAAEQRLRSAIIGKEIILCGHSQGGLVAIEFWKKFNHVYDIKGIITISSPLQGASIIKSLSSSSLYSIIEDNERTCCNTCLSCMMPSCVAPIFKCCSCCCKGILDLAPDSELINSHRNAYRQMADLNLPFLNIISDCPGIPDDFNYSPFGKKSTKNIVGGGKNKKSDNLLSVLDQQLLQSWINLKEIVVHADHGMFDVRREEGNIIHYNNRLYPRVFSSDDVIRSVVEFCNNN